MSGRGIRAGASVMMVWPGNRAQKQGLAPFLLGFLGQDAALEDPRCSTVQRRCKSPRVWHLLAMCFPHGL